MILNVEFAENNAVTDVNFNEETSSLDVEFIEVDASFQADFDESDTSMEAEFGEIHEVEINGVTVKDDGDGNVTIDGMVGQQAFDHRNLKFRDEADQHPVKAITGLREELDTMKFKPDKTLSFKDGVLSVNTANAVEEDNTLPITAASVFVTVGNIEELLKTI